MAAAQLKVPTGIWNFYPERDQTRREHLLELQEQFGYQAFTVAVTGGSRSDLTPEPIRRTKACDWPRRW
jgi:hypothetical protein